MGKIRMLTQISILKTLYMNFKTQKFVNAVKLPIWVGKHTKLDICWGGVLIRSNISSGMIRIGIGGSPDLFYYEARKNYVGVARGARLVFNGFTHFAPHTSVLVGENAELLFGSNFSSNNGCRYSAMNKIEFGNNVLLGGNCVIRDSDGHRIYDVDEDKKKARKNSAPVKIGNHVWIANNCHVLKGVTIADDTIIGYNSLIVGNVCECNSIYAGTPAKLIKSGVVWER